MKEFWFNGRSSREFGMMISGEATYNAPERDVETVSIEGRNGDLIIDKGRFKNVTVSIPVSICRDFPEKAAAARAWLLGSAGYQRLETDYDPEHFRLAAFTGPLDFDVGFLNRTGEAVLQFNCKPQRFLKSGEVGKGNSFDFTEAGELYNPTPFPALPHILVGFGETGGSITVNDVTVEIVAGAILGILEIDCETQHVHLGVNDRNSWVKADSFPVLVPGVNTVSFDGSVSQVCIQPRWWTV